ncbi:hypothetical protein PTD2_04536 [Pseudoalteromonas tunicata D2]|jgi:hypothetical protein|uniref:Lipoprotein n=3 Tax=Pseudoalteromonas tunicata TaxID=314281 RepID=A4C5H8_9GAMM|nr:hypothetical protein [Pseudoalteromonas tunicata]EAR30810.1 hypothetical protein PTD2_04536 [Pseudoalteromonas tunicata D2]
MEMTMHNIKKGFGIAFMFGLTAVLTGCGESSDELDDKLNHDVKITLVNSLDYMVDFHVKKRSISTGYSGLFDSDKIASKDIPSNSVANTYNYSYKVTNNMVNFGVRDSINADKEDRMTTTLSKNDNLWVIAWEASGDRELSVVDKKQSNNADVFNVRLFANGNYAVSVDGNHVLNTEKGKVTTYLKVANCANGLKVADKAIDLCTGDFAKSYLLVVDNSGKRVMAEE